MWIFFRADSLSEAIMLLKKIAKCNFGSIVPEISSCFYLKEIDFLLNNLHINLMKVSPNFMLIVFFVIALFMILGSKNSYEKMNIFQPSIKNIFFTSFLLIWCVFSFTGISIFLYFNF